MKYVYLIYEGGGPDSVLMEIYSFKRLAEARVKELEKKYNYTREYFIRPEPLDCKSI